MDGYRSYCAVCCNYCLLHRFVTGEYVCGRCERKIITALRKRDIYTDRHLPLPVKEIDEVIEALQKDTEGGRKVLESDYRKKQRPAKYVSSLLSEHRQHNSTYAGQPDATAYPAFRKQDKHRDTD